MISELVIVFSVLLTLAGFAYQSARFYLHVTDGMSSHTLPAKLRKPVSFSRKVFVTAVLAFLVVFSLHFLEVFPFAVFDWALTLMVFTALPTFLVLVVAPLVSLFSDRARERAAASTEAKVSRFLLIALFVAAKFAWKAFAYIVKLSANSRSGGNYHDGGNRSPYSYHGYLSYQEESKRSTGKRY